MPGHDKSSGENTTSHSGSIACDLREWNRSRSRDAILTLLTLGGYGAWAKARRLRDLYAAVSIGETTIQCDARGADMAAGRALMLFLLGAYVAWKISAGSLLSFGAADLNALRSAGSLQLFGGSALGGSALGGSALIGPILFTILFTLLSGILVRDGLSHNASLFRIDGRRLSYGASLVSSAWSFAALPLIGVLTLGLATPLILPAISRQVARGFRLGGEAVAFKDPGFLRLAAPGLVAMLLLAPLVGIAMLANIVIFIRDLEGAERAARAIVVLAPVGALLVSLGVFLLAVMSAMMRNAILSGISLPDGRRVSSSLHPLRYGWLAWSNLILKVVSIGMPSGWCDLRRARALAAATSLSEPVENIASNPAATLTDRPGATSGDVKPSLRKRVSLAAAGAFLSFSGIGIGV